MKSHNANMLWIGNKLSQIEIASILSVLKCGHPLTLFGYGRPHNLPEGVRWENANEVLSQSDFLFYKNTNPGLGSDLFRYKLMERDLGIWFDADVLLLKPIPKTDQNIYGWEDDKLINGAVLYINREDVLLTELLKFVGTEYPVPPFFSKKGQLELFLKKLLRKPVPVTQLPWGVWGPDAITYFAKKTKTDHLAKSKEVYYPIPWKKSHSIFMTDADVDEQIEPTTVAIHLWNATLRHPTKLRPHVPLGKLIIEDDCFFKRFCKSELNYEVQSEE